MDELIRIDKWLWSVRCTLPAVWLQRSVRRGEFTIGGLVVKPSRVVKIGEIILVKKNPVTYTYKVIELLGTRG